MKLEAKIDRMVNKGNVKAIASISLDGMYVIKGLKVMDGRKGLFVSMPQESYPGQDGKTKYSNLFFGLTNFARAELQRTVLEAYQIKLDPNYSVEQYAGGIPPHIRDQWNYDPQQYPEPHYPEPDYMEPEYPDFLVDSDDMLPMGIY